MLITDRATPLLAKQDIKCFKVMVQRKSGFYVCPPAFQNFVNNKIDLVEYHLSELYKTDSLDASKDYRINGEIGAGFYHTFCGIESAQNFAKKINEKILNPNTSKYPELYKIPDGALIVILNAHIPQGSLYYEGFYQGKKNKICDKTYASNKVIYDSVVR